MMTPSLADALVRTLPCVVVAADPTRIRRHGFESRLERVGATIARIVAPQHWNQEIAIAAECVIVALEGLVPGIAKAIADNCKQRGTPCFLLPTQSSATSPSAAWRTLAEHIKEHGINPLTEVRPNMALVPTPPPSQADTAATDDSDLRVVNERIRRQRDQLAARINELQAQLAKSAPPVAGEALAALERDLADARARNISLEEKAHELEMKYLDATRAAEEKAREQKVDVNAPTIPPPAFASRVEASRLSVIESTLHELAGMVAEFKAQHARALGQMHAFLMHLESMSLPPLRAPVPPPAPPPAPPVVARSGDTLVSERGIEARTSEEEKVKAKLEEIRRYKREHERMRREKRRAEDRAAAAAPFEPAKPTPVKPTKPTPPKPAKPPPPLSTRTTTRTLEGDRIEDHVRRYVRTHGGATAVEIAAALSREGRGGQSSIKTCVGNLKAAGAFRVVGDVKPFRLYLR